MIPADLPPAVRLHAEAVARAAQRLVALRDAWLNPPEWTERTPALPDDEILRRLLALNRERAAM